MNESMVMNEMERVDEVGGVMRWDYDDKGKKKKNSAAILPQYIFRGEKVVIDTAAWEVSDKVFCWYKNIYKLYYLSNKVKEEYEECKREHELGCVRTRTGSPIGFYITVGVDDIKKNGKACDLGLGNGIKWLLPVKIVKQTANGRVSWSVYLRVETKDSVQPLKSKSTRPLGDDTRLPVGDDTLPRETVQVVIDPDKPTCGGGGPGQ